MDTVLAYRGKVIALMDRKIALERIVRNLEEQDLVISPLGFISRDLYAITSSIREHCFYCMGSMGSVTPLALGISLAQPQARVFALEGDGALLMNLGTLVTLRRYGSHRIRLVIFDNGCYESTGGQPSQPDDFQLENICRAAGLATQVAELPEQVDAFVQSSDSNGPQLLVMKVARMPPSPRVADDPADISLRFAEHLKTLKGAGSS